jgi:2-polyprenyl-3-methyl-5-hydroxy-6-metoxy-1,4-benzoquinol methylase
MAREFVFDQKHTIDICEKRKDTLDALLPGLIAEYSLKNALDVGCGIGYFSGYLETLGLDVVALDGREENIDEARERYQGVDFLVFDVENPDVRELGAFDLVLCLGLLYHLENPFQAIRNMQALTKKILVVESMITPVTEPVAALVDEGKIEDQSLRYIAFMPSESCIVKMLYHAGFENVYRVSPLPDHQDFHNSFSYKKRRTMLVASSQELGLPQLTIVREKPLQELWLRIPGKLVRYMKQAGIKLRDVFEG